MTLLTSRQTEFIESVLSLRPRVAAFDCDGTLWSGDAGKRTFLLGTGPGTGQKTGAGRDCALGLRALCRLQSRLGRRRHHVRRNGHHASRTREEIVQQACDAYFAQGIAANIFPEMRQLVERLRASGCDVWAVSSSCQWIIRSAMRYFGIPLGYIASWLPKRPSKTAPSPISSFKFPAVPARWRRFDPRSSRLPITGPIAPLATRSGTARC